MSHNIANVYQLLRTRAAACVRRVNRSHIVVQWMLVLTLALCTSTNSIRIRNRIVAFDGTVGAVAC